MHRWAWLDWGLMLCRGYPVESASYMHNSRTSHIRLHHPSTRLPVILCIAWLGASIHNYWGMAASEICDCGPHRCAP